jgi:hypothetical protein
MHGYESIQPWFGEPLLGDSSEPGMNYKSATTVAQMMGIEFNQSKPGYGGMIVITADRTKDVDVTGYQRLLRPAFFHSGERPKSFEAGRISYRLNDDLGTLDVFMHPPGMSVDSIRLSLIDRVDEIVKSQGFLTINRFPPDSLCIIGSCASGRAKICLQEVRVQQNEKGLRVTGFDGDLLYSFAETQK